MVSRMAGFLFRWKGRGVRHRGRPSPSAADEERPYSKQLAEQLGEAQDRLALQDDPALVQAKTPDEVAQEQRTQREIRSAFRNEERNRALAQVQACVAERELATDLRKHEHSDTLWFRRARSEAQRLASLSSRTARLYRSYQRQKLALMATALLGILWGAVNVQQGIIQWQSLDATHLLWYLSLGLEPLVTVPLVVLMTYQATLAEEGQQTRWRDQFPLRLVEASLLLMACAMNVAPHRGEGATALLYLVPPVMITVSMIMLPIMSRHLGALLLRAHAELQAADRSTDSEATGPAVHAEPVGTTEPAGTALAAHEDVPTEHRSVADATARLVATAADRSAHRSSKDTSSEAAAGSVPGIRWSGTGQGVTTPVSVPQQHREQQAATSTAGETGESTGRPTLPTGQQLPSAASTGPAPADRSTVETGEHTTVITDEVVIEDLLQPVADCFVTSDDWLSRNDVMQLTGAGAGRAGRLLAKLNEHYPNRPEPQPRRSGRQQEIQDALDRPVHLSAAPDRR